MSAMVARQMLQVLLKKKKMVMIKLYRSTYNDIYSLQEERLYLEVHAAIGTRISATTEP